jgi:hypothetical protein
VKESFDLRGVQVDSDDVLNAAGIRTPTCVAMASARVGFAVPAKIEKSSGTSYRALFRR